jgi:hypothetical protein
MLAKPKSGPDYSVFIMKYYIHKKVKVKLSP